MNAYWKSALWFIGFETLYWGGGVYTFETLTEIFKISTFNWAGNIIHLLMLLIGIWCLKNTIQIGIEEIIRKLK